MVILTACSGINLDNSYLTGCENQAKILIPRGATLTNFGNYWQIKEFRWTDGYQINSLTLSNIEYKQGNAQGQNVNYYYPQGFLGDTTYLGYSQNIIDFEGNILGSNRFSAELILKPTRDISQATEYEEVEFEIVDVNYRDCNFVGDIKGDIRPYINTPNLKEIDLDRDELSVARSKDKIDLSLKERFLLINSDMSKEQIIELIGEPDMKEYPVIKSKKDGIDSETKIVQWYYNDYPNRLWIQLDSEEKDIGAIVLHENKEFIKK